MPKHALVVKSDLSTEILDITMNELEQLQKAVEGLIQPVELAELITMWVNEEGLFQDGLEFNPLASAFMQEIGSDTPILGNAVFTGGCDEDGNTIGMAEDAMEDLIKITNQARELLFG